MTAFSAFLQQLIFLQLAGINQIGPAEIPSASSLRADRAVWGQPQRLPRLAAGIRQVGLIQLNP